MIDRMPPPSAKPLIDSKPVPDISAAVGFKVLLARAAEQGALSEPAPAFNRERDSASHAVSFAAMPLVGSIAVASPASVATSAPTEDLAFPGSASSVSAEETRGDLPTSLPAVSVARWGQEKPAELHLPAPIASSAVGSRASAPFVPATPPQPATKPATATRIADHRKAAGPERSPEIRTETPAATGLAVHLVGANGELRVIVRGAALSVHERGEAIARIARLLRSHGHVISERSIDMEGTER
jgi:hypothetical protein